MGFCVPTVTPVCESVQFCPLRGSHAPCILRPLSRRLADTCSVWLQVVCWELLTKERFYGAGARSHAVIAQLCGRAALPTEAALCSDLCRRLGGGRICASILSMLSRAPDRRPAVGALLRQWKAAFGQADVDGDTPCGLDA